MFGVLNLQVLSSSCFISGTVRMPAIKEVGHLISNMGGDQLCLCYRIIFYNFYIGLDCFSQKKYHKKTSY